MSDKDIRNDTLYKLADLRESLKSFMKPKILSKLADLLEELGGDRKSHVKQYKLWIEKNGADCRYASFAKQFFLDDHAENVAQCINELYHNWSKLYEKKEK
jgi:hypothetical protein